MVIELGNAKSLLYELGVAKPHQLKRNTPFAKPVEADFTKGVVNLFVKRFS